MKTKSKPLFVKPSPLKRRAIALVKLLMLLTVVTVVIYLTRKPAEDAPPPWMPPVEPPGTVIMTINTSPAPAFKSTEIIERTSQDARAPVPAEAPAVATPVQNTVSTVARTAENNPVPATQASSLSATREAQKIALQQALNQWSKAWSRRDVPAYMAAYAEDFSPPNGMSRKVWEQSRHARITGKKAITHTMQNLTIDIGNSTAVVKFTQIYSDERLKTSDKKIMEWVNRNGRWLILREAIE